MNKKSKKFILYFFIFCFLLLTLTGCSTNDDDENVLKDKIKSEISYLDTRLIGMLNSANGISLENYIVKAEEINEEETSSGSVNKSSSDSQNDNSSESSKEGEGEDNAKETIESDFNEVKYKMEGNEILLQNRNIDWNLLKSEIEKLYSSWTTIVLDLYKINISNDDILAFNKDLDVAIQAIKSEDKVQTLNSLSKLYSYIPKFSIAFNNNKISNIYQTKSNLLNAYVLVEQDNITELQKQLSNAEQAFLPIVNDITSQNNNQSNINKAYILIKELQNYTNTDDKDVFYIKYKNLIQELNNIE